MQQCMIVANYESKNMCTYGSSKNLKKIKVAVRLDAELIRRTAEETYDVSRVAFTSPLFITTACGWQPQKARCIFLIFISVTLKVQSEIL